MEWSVQLPADTRLGLRGPNTMISLNVTCGEPYPPPAAASPGVAELAAAVKEKIKDKSYRTKPLASS